VRVGVADAGRAAGGFGVAGGAIGGCANDPEGRIGPEGRAGADGIAGVGRADATGAIVGRGAKAGGRTPLGVAPGVALVGVPDAGRGGNIAGLAAGVPVGGVAGGMMGRIAGRTVELSAALGGVGSGAGGLAGTAAAAPIDGVDMAVAGANLDSAGVDRADASLYPVGANSSSIELPAPIVITPPQTEQRARRPSSGIFAGSTRKTDRHSGHETFTSPPSLGPSRAVSILSSTHRPATHPCVDRSRKPSREVFSRSSSFQSRARSPAPHG